MNRLIFLLVFSLPFSCAKNKPIPKHSFTVIKLSLEEANRLSKLPLECMQTEFPNKLGQTLGDSSDLKTPKELHPAFYGCFDWHSSVHGHWMLIYLLKTFPDLENQKKIREKLLGNISQENIIKEVDYFKGQYHKSFERTYGWAWLLKLAEELYTWEDPLAQELINNLKPLTDLIIDKYLEFLPKLAYPIRVGEHSNTAFGLAFAFDYAKTTQQDSLQSIIVNKSKEFYLSDVDCPMTWEPGGFDFLSPCLEEANLIRRILPHDEFNRWLEKFLPELKNINYQLAAGKVNDRSDGKLIHLDGVNFSRAWCLAPIANQNEQYNHLIKIANDHIDYSLPKIVDHNYQGTHWLGTFAVYALSQQGNKTK